MMSTQLIARGHAKDWNEFMFANTPKSILFLFGTTLVMSGCSLMAPASQMTAQEQDIKTSLDSSEFMPASRQMRDNIETQELFAQAAFWSREYDLNPSDLESTLKLAAALRKLGNPQRAIEITQISRALYPKDPYLGAEFAAALIASERAPEAMEPLDQMLRIAPGYARLWSLKGAALDQTEQYDLARKHYARAMQITPNDPNILTNIGLSYALAGDAPTAEGWLRRASAMPGASPAVQQNLALILKLQGKTAESEKISARIPQRRTQMSPPAPRQASAPPLMRRGPASPTAKYSHPQQNYNANPSLPGGQSYTSRQNGQAYSSASEAARDAARRAAQRPKQDMLSPEMAQQQARMLEQLKAKGIGGYPQMAGPGQTAPQTYSQNQQSAARSSAARRRR